MRQARFESHLDRFTLVEATGVDPRSHKPVCPQVQLADAANSEGAENAARRWPRT